MTDNGFGKLSMQVDDRDIDIGQDDALPSVETTMRFLALCDRYGSPEAAAAAVARVRRAGVARPARVAGVDRRPDACSGRVPPGGGRGYDGIRSCALAATRIRRTLSAAPGGGRGCAYGSGSGRDGLAVASKEAGSRCRKAEFLDALKDEEKSLRTQLVAIQRAIEALEGADAPASAGRGKKKAPKIVTKRKRTMTEEQRQAVADRMRKYWASRREAKAEE